MCSLFNSECRNVLSPTGFVLVPEGEYDGQIVLGSSYSYIYPVKKFIVEPTSDLIMLELDPTKMETDGE